MHSSVESRQLLVTNVRKKYNVMEIIKCGMRNSPRELSYSALGHLPLVLMLVNFMST